MTLLTVAGVRYEVRSGGDGPPLLLLHGFTGRGADWGPMLPAFRRHARTPITDTDHCLPIGFAQRHGDRAGSVTTRIFQQVAHDPAQ